jgi:hypothetical protein
VVLNADLSASRIEQDSGDFLAPLPLHLTGVRASVKRGQPHPRRSGQG